MAGQRRTGRTVEQWNAITPGNRRRWIRAFGSEDAGLEAYRNGLSLTASQRGHATTPERPIRALLQPTKYPKYIHLHTAELNELARSRGLAEHGTGPRGEKPETSDYWMAGGEFTWVVPQGTVGRPLWNNPASFGSEEQAQLYARRSWAPAGVVIIVDSEWIPGETPPPKPPPDTTSPLRYQVWFARDSDLLPPDMKMRKKARKKNRKK